MPKLNESEFLTEAERYLLDHPAQHPVEAQVHNGLVADLLRTISELREGLDPEEAADPDSCLGDMYRTMQGEPHDSVGGRKLLLLVGKMLEVLPDSTPAPIITMTDEGGEDRLACLWESSQGLVGFTVAFDGLVAIHLHDTPENGINEDCLEDLIEILRELAQ